MDAAEAHEQLTNATGGRAADLPPRPITDASVPRRQLEQFAADARQLADLAAAVVDEEGREVWLTAGEVELDQWASRLASAAAVVHRQLGGES